MVSHSDESRIVAWVRCGSKQSMVCWHKLESKITFLWVDDNPQVPVGRIVRFPVFEGLQGIIVGTNVLNILIRSDLGVFMIKSVEGNIKIVG